MMLDARPSIEYLLVHVNMCDRTDMMINRESSLSLKVVVTVFIIGVVAIFIGVFNV